MGIDGTGGAFTALRTGAEALAGDGSRNVRSVIEPELPLRINCAPGGPRPDPELPAEDVEPALLSVLFVCTSATEMGVVGINRNAVAAAADERATSDALEFKSLRKAWAAAVVAEALALGPFRGGFEAALLLLFPNMADFSSANQGLMRKLSH